MSRPCRASPTGTTSVWAQYTIRLAGGRRDALAATLARAGHPDRGSTIRSRCTARRLSGFPVAEGGLPVSERLADEVISLPMHAYLDEPTQDRIIAAVRGALRA